jgi:hypothetical protein
VTEIVTLKLPDALAQRAKAVVRQTNRCVEDVLLEWLNQVEVEPVVESLPDDQRLALCDLQMESDQSEEMSDLLARNREGQLNEADHRRLEQT